jgi:hypothetical protein
MEGLNHGDTEKVAGAGTAIFQTTSQKTKLGCLCLLL